jgi:hypothetical protein
MFRHTAALALVVCLAPSLASAQNVEFTINVPTAAVRKAPSTASPIIGQAPRGAVLPVTRDIGAWLKVAWPEAEDGIGYVHQTMGARSHKTTLEERVATALPPAPPEQSPSAQTIDVVRDTPPPVPMSPHTQYVSAPTHVVGLGGRMGRPSNDDYGVSARVWSRKRFGVHFDASRSTLFSTEAAGRVKSTQFTPSVVVALADQVTDNVWVRPYVGGGIAWQRAKFDLGPGGVSPTDSTMGFRAFGGGELTFPSLPRFAVSADLGYLWSKELFPGFDPSRLGFSVAGHWYVK